MGHPYYSAVRDQEIIDAGGFFCKACLIGKPASEASPDPRYCHGCYDFLLQEAAMVTGHVKKPNWIPIQAAPPVPQHGGEFMAPLETEKSEVDIIHPSVTCGTATAKRGPKRRQLPEDLIIRLADEGMGSKAIAARLKADCGIAISYKTVQRVLSGERRQGSNYG